MEAIRQVGLVPLLNSGIPGFSADEMVDPDCRYVMTDNGWDWPLWDWKGPMVTEGHFAYGKFFNAKAGFITMDWWPDFCNWRRSTNPEPEEESIEGIILDILRVNGSMITRDLRTACGFVGESSPVGSNHQSTTRHPSKSKTGNLRSRFDAYVTRLQMACRLVTEDFVYPHDKHGNPYGWGWALLTTPEQLFGRDACHCPRTPQQSRDRILSHLHGILPQASEKQLLKLI